MLLFFVSSEAVDDAGSGSEEAAVVSELVDGVAVSGCLLSSGGAIVCGNKCSFR